MATKAATHYLVTAPALEPALIPMRTSYRSIVVQLLLTPV